MSTSFRPALATLATGLALLAATGARANNIQVANATLTGNTGTVVQVQFDLSWENSWRGVGMPNYDAAWVFVKYRTSAGVWGHALLSNTGNVAPAGSQIDAGLLTPSAAYNAGTNPVIGNFVYRNAAGTGTFALTSVQFSWPYAAQGLVFANIAQVQVFGIEMVNVPTGAYAYNSQGATLTTINTAAANTVPSGSGSLGGQGGGCPTGFTPLPAVYPNGFNAFYCMKYETSQQGYVDFLNTLTYDQQVARTGVLPTSVAGTGAMGFANANRNTIDIQTPGVANTVPAVYACNLDADAVYGEATDGKDLVMNLMNGDDLMAYLDWSGLRPMTEMEYNKACRGTNLPVANEYAWGTATINNAAQTFANAGANNEGIATGYSTTLGNQNTTGNPARVGIYAANAGNSGRVTAGATFYGIMEMTGSTCDPAVHPRSSPATLYTGTHGNGLLTAAGVADPATWPAFATGFTWLGGYFGFAQTIQSIVCSTTAPCTTGRDNNTGGRGVRTQ